MKLLIDIPEHIYEHAKEMSEDSRDEGEAMRAIANGSQQESCGDAISRQAVLEGIRNLYPDIPVVDIMGARRKWLDKYAPYFECENVVEQLPSVTPQQRTGRWVKEGQGGRYKWMCSNCGTHHRALYDYCPSCGCKMEVEE